MSKCVLKPGLAVYLSLLLAVLIGSTAQAFASSQPAREVLPDTVIPLDYNLLLTPDAAALTFNGRLRITIEVLRPTADILLNAVHLRFERVFVGGREAIVTADEKLGRAALHVSTPLTVGQHIVAIDYTGTIGRQRLGSSPWIMLQGRPAADPGD